MGKDLVSLTHVCRSWREALTGCPALWSYLDFTSTERTRIFIERAQSSPLEIFIRDFRSYKTFLLVLPHVARIVSISLVGSEGIIRLFTRYLSCPIPSLKILTIILTGSVPFPLNDTLFNGDVSSLRTLNLSGVIPHIPWKNLRNITTFTLRHVPESAVSVTELLDFFEQAPLLCEIALRYSSPDSSDAPPERVVPLPSLKNFKILTDFQPSSILLNHLSIPAGAFLHQELDVGSGLSLRSFLPETIGNLQNTSYISSVYLNFGDEDVSLLLDGPSGRFSVRGYGINWSSTPSESILWSLGCFDLSRTRRLAVSTYEFQTLWKIKNPVRRILDATKDLRQIFLNQRNNTPFILALNPNLSSGSSNPVPCPKLEDLILYVEHGESLDISGLVEMAKWRALEGAKLKSITVVSGGIVSPKEVRLLARHATRVECRSEEGQPKWDDICFC